MLSNPSPLTRIPPARGVLFFLRRDRNWHLAKATGVFVAEEPDILQRTAVHQSLQPQWEKHTKRASQPRLNGNVDIDWNYDCDALNVSEPGLINMYNELGLTEHEMKDDTNSNFVDLAVAHSSYPPSPSSGDSPREGSVCVKGRLKDHLSFWHTIKANQWVISIIRDGYTLPFVELPPRKRMENHKSAADEKEFVAEQVEELLLTGCVTEVNCADIHIYSPLVVVKNSVKKRLILHLRFVNKYLRIPKFKYEEARDILALSDWFFKFDYKSGYHHVDILPYHQKFLGFSWTLAGVKKWFAFTVLPFGLASAPYVFSKIQKALVKHWREQGIRIFTYLDDGAGADRTLEAARAASSRIKADVAASGFVAHPEKRCWEPTQEGELLGFILNLRTGVIRVPPRHIEGNSLQIFHSS